MSGVIRWARNCQLARYANVSKMTIWRWKQQHHDFPPAAVIDGTEYNDLDAFDRWMASHVGNAPTRGRRTAKNLEPRSGREKRAPQGSKSEM
jgi:hypothetical protein